MKYLSNGHLNGYAYLNGKLVNVNIVRSDYDATPNDADDMFVLTGKHGDKTYTFSINNYYLSVDAFKGNCHPNPYDEKDCYFAGKFGMASDSQQNLYGYVIENGQIVRNTFPKRFSCLYKENGIESFPTDYKDVKIYPTLKEASLYLDVTVVDEDNSERVEQGVGNAVALSDKQKEVIETIKKMLTDNNISLFFDVDGCYVYAYNTEKYDVESVYEDDVEGVNIQATKKSHGTCIQIGYHGCDDTFDARKKQ